MEEDGVGVDVGELEQMELDVGNEALPVSRLSQLGRKRVTLVVAATIVLGFLLVAAVCVGVVYYEGEESRSGDGSNGPGYGVVIDMGSSGSRVHVYQWDDPTNVQAAPGFSPFWVMKVKPGISSYAGDPAAGAKSLIPLLNYAIQQLRSVNATITEVPIYLYATAGMRLVDPVDEAALYGAIRALINDETHFLFQDSWARTISGDEEAMFDWMSAEQLLSLNPSSAPPGLSGGETVGIIDLGGSSVEVAFEASPPEDEEDVREFFETVDVGGDTFSLYRYSYLLYGHRAARTGLQEQLAESQAGNETVLNPCFLDGYTEELETMHGVISFLGTGDPDQCVTEIRRYLNVSAPCPYSRCSFNGIYQPTLSGLYLGIDDFARSIFFFDLEPMSSPSDILVAASAFCEMPWRQAVVDYEDLPDTGVDLAYYCFEGVYASALSIAIGIPESGENVRYQTTLGEFSLEWPLGAMVYELDLL